MRTVSTKPVREVRDSIADIWGERTPHQGEWPVRVDERLIEEPDRWVQSTCVFCSTGCAVDLGVKENRLVGIRGRAVDRVNKGRLGPKGLHGWIANESRDRLTSPMLRRGNRLEAVSWEDAFQVLVGRSRDLIDRYGGGTIGFYNSGQMFLEEYYTLAILGYGGIKTPHMDGNTRLCTATSAMALMESFGTDGDPGSYRDFDVTNCIFHIGHNPAWTQTVLWARILDRLQSANRPALIVVDPRRTPTAEEATVHLAPRLGSNLALMNGLLHLIIKAGRMDLEWIDAHTVGYHDLEHTVSSYTPERVSGLTNVPVRQLEEAADILGTTESLVSTVLQGVYQSNQATASAVQVNNLHLIRGLIGKPGSTVFQMNGQPTAQNTRECGANGELAAFLNYKNPDHVARLARHWNIEPQWIPHYAPPTHVMNIFRLAEEGSIRLLWIIATNPAVSLPELHRIRRILKKPEVFVVVQDGFISETAQLADLVLPAAFWAEKTGCFTNADRTVHISHQAIEPPGEARSDLAIFIEYAERMDFRDKEGAPLIKWRDAESAFEHFKQLTKGRPCDYSGMTYAKLSAGSGIQWPCNEEYPEGKERLYENGQFSTAADYCEIYGHDLMTGAPIDAASYHAKNPNGKAKIKSADYRPPPEEPDEKYPFWLTTGRLVYHFHTRTKTGRAEALNDAAPDVYVQMASQDAARYGVTDGDVLSVESRRGSVEARVRVGDIAEGHLFIPFHYGYWDEDSDDVDRRRAANELTITAWDPVSKQPHFKFAAVRIKKVA
jgi:anaerobic selenocysteine-containing dehydrogenase